MPFPSCHRIKRVNSFHELITTPFENGINALCWERALPGDFSEIVKHFPADETGDVNFIRWCQ